MRPFSIQSVSPGGRHSGRTVVGLKQLAGRGVEVLQLEVTGPLQRHAEALGVPAALPQHVLREAARARAHVGEVQQLSVVLPRQRPLRTDQ